MAGHFPAYKSRQFSLSGCECRNLQKNCVTCREGGRPGRRISRWRRWPTCGCYPFRLRVPVSGNGDSNRDGRPNPSWRWRANRASCVGNRPSHPPCIAANIPPQKKDQSILNLIGTNREIRRNVQGHPGRYQSTRRGRDRIWNRRIRPILICRGSACGRVHNRNSKFRFDCCRSAQFKIEFPVS